MKKVIFLILALTAIGQAATFPLGVFRGTDTINVGPLYTWNATGLKALPDSGNITVLRGADTLKYIRYASWASLRDAYFFNPAYLSSDTGVYFFTKIDSLVNTGAVGFYSATIRFYAEGQPTPHYVSFYKTATTPDSMYVSAETKAAIAKASADSVNQRLTVVKDSIQAILDSIQLQDDQYVKLKDSLQAALDTLQRFTKVTTDSLQAVLDSIYLLDEKYTDLNDDSTGAAAGGGATITQIDSLLDADLATAEDVWAVKIDSFSEDSSAGYHMMNIATGSSNWSDAQRDSLLSALGDTRIHNKAWGSNTARQLTAFDEDVTTIDINATTIGAIGSNGISTASIAEGALTMSRFDKDFYTTIAETTDNRSMALTLATRQELMDSMKTRGFVTLNDSNTIQKLVGDTVWTDSRRITPTKVRDTLWLYDSSGDHFAKLSDSSEFQGAAAGLTKGDIIDTFLTYDDGGNHFALLSDSLAFQGTANSLTATKVKDTVMAAIEDTTSGYGLWLLGYLADIADDSTTTTDVDYGKIADTVWSNHRTKQVDDVLNAVYVSSMADGAIKPATLDPGVYGVVSDSVWEYANTGELGLTTLGGALRRVDIATDGSGGDGIEGNIQNVMDVIGNISLDSTAFPTGYWTKLGLTATGADSIIVSVTDTAANNLVNLIRGVGPKAETLKVMSATDSSAINGAEITITLYDGTIVGKYLTTNAAGKAINLLDTTISYQIIIEHSSYVQHWDSLHAPWDGSAAFPIYMTSLTYPSPADGAHTICRVNVNVAQSGKVRTGWRLTAKPTYNYWQVTGGSVYPKETFTAVSDTNGWVQLDLLQTIQAAPHGTDSLKYEFTLEKISGGAATLITPALTVPATTPFDITGWTARK